jgi:hypothetical protein
MMVILHSIVLALDTIHIDKFKWVCTSWSPKPMDIYKRIRYLILDWKLEYESNLANVMSWGEDKWIISKI